MNILQKRLFPAGVRSLDFVLFVRTVSIATFRSYADHSARTLKKGRGDFESDKLPVVTLVRRSDGRVRFLVRDDLEDVDEDITEYGDETVILCTDQYSIYDGIDEYDEIDGHLAINHDEHYVVGDAHTNSCENRHSFLRNQLRRFRGVSKHHLQGYLNFLGYLLNTDDWFEKILGTNFYR